MPNDIKFEMITEIGTANLGKYTLPKIPALLVNVLDVATRQDEK